MRSWLAILEFGESGIHLRQKRWNIGIGQGRFEKLPAGIFQNGTRQRPVGIGRHWNRVRNGCDSVLPLLRRVWRIQQLVSDRFTQWQGEGRLQQPHLLVRRTQPADEKPGSQLFSGVVFKTAYEGPSTTTRCVPLEGKGISVQASGLPLAASAWICGRMS